MATVSVPARFNGPLENGNGGYSAGLLAATLEGPVEVTLRRPVPLDTELDTLVEGDSARLLDGDRLIAEARAIPELELELPAPVSVEDARTAMERYRGLDEGPFSRCFVCGRGRPDSLGVFSGSVEGRDLVASTWTPPEWAAEGGRARPEFVWAVLDCPTFFGAYLGIDELPLSFLGRITARVDTLPAPGEELVMISWPLGIDGRKADAGVALLDREGEPLAVARATLIEAKGE